MSPSRLARECRVFKKIKTIFHLHDNNLVNCGLSACSWYVEPNIIKITSSISDGVAATEIMGLAQFYDILVSIYDVRVLASGKHWLIQEEYLHPLPDYAKNIVDNLKHSFITGKVIPYQNVSGAWELVRKLDPALGLHILADEEYPYFEIIFFKFHRLLSLAKYLKLDNKNFIIDAHPKNWGLRDSNSLESMVLLDIQGGPNFDPDSPDYEI